MPHKILMPKRISFQEKLTDLTDIEEHQIRTAPRLDAFFHSMAETIKINALAKNKKQE